MPKRKRHNRRYMFYNKSFRVFIDVRTYSLPEALRIIRNLIPSFPANWQHYRSNMVIDLPDYTAL